MPHNSSSYRIDAAINKVRSCVDPLDDIEQKFQDYQKVLPQTAFDTFSKHPQLLPFVCSSFVLKTLLFLSKVETWWKKIQPGRRRADWHGKRPERNVVRDETFVCEKRPPRFFVDVTAAHRGLVGGGIKRACLKIADALARSGDARPVVVRDGVLCTYELGGTIGASEQIQQNDTYIILDAFWDPFFEYKEMLILARARGARTAICIHDALPITKPGLVVDEWADWFGRCLSEMLPHVDFILSVSCASAREVADAIKPFQSEKPVSWFYLGADVFKETGGQSIAPIARVANHRFSSTPSFVSIGTIEPKKGYDCALDAFEMLWARDIDVSYTIIGRPGWLCSGTINRIKKHPDFGRRLFWLNDASDADVERVLNESFCYVQASLAEGFGLPVVEAAALGLPVIASDLPVFQEICTANVTFFPVGDAPALAEVVEGALQSRPAPAVTMQLSWMESARALIEALATGSDANTRSEKWGRV